MLASALNVIEKRRIHSQNKRKPNVKDARSRLARAIRAIDTARIAGGIIAALIKLIKTLLKNI